MKLPEDMTTYIFLKREKLQMTSPTPIQNERGRISITGCRLIAVMAT